MSWLRSRLPGVFAGEASNGLFDFPTRPRRSDHHIDYLYDLLAFGSRIRVADAFADHSERHVYPRIGLHREEVSLILLLHRSPATMAKGVRSILFLLHTSSHLLTPYSDALLDALIVAKRLILEQSNRDIRFLATINLKSVMNKSIRYSSALSFASPQRTFATTSATSTTSPFSRPSCCSPRSPPSTSIATTPSPSLRPACCTSIR